LSRAVSAAKSIAALAAEVTFGRQKDFSATCSVVPLLNLTLVISSRSQARGGAAGTSEESAVAGQGERLKSLCSEKKNARENSVHTESS
jgi:hypothetical protein